MPKMIPIDHTQQGISIEKWLKNHYPYIPHAQRHKLIRTGQIRLNGSRVKPATKLTNGDHLRLPPHIDHHTNPPNPPKNPSKADAQFIRSRILYQDDHIIALNKPSGIAVQGGTKTTKHIDALLEALTENTPSSEKPRITHRLDRDTSGVLLIAKNRQTATHITALFKQRNIQKIYLAVTVGVPNPPTGTIRLPLLKIGKKEKTHIANHNIQNAKSATTQYHVTDTVGKKFAHVTLYPQTGRTHQLRAHMSAIGTPILGDGKYGGKKAHPNINTAKKLHLHAATLNFIHPHTGKNITIHAPTPHHMRETINMLGFNI